MANIDDRVLGKSAKPLRLALAGFAVAVLGAALAFSIDYGPHNPLSYAAFGLAALGVLIGCVGIVWAWATMGSAFFKRKEGK